MIRTLLRGAAAVPLALPAQEAAVGYGWETLHEHLEITVDPGAGRLVVAGTMRVKLVDDDDSAGFSLAVNSRTRSLQFERVEVAGSEIELNASHPNLTALALAHVNLDDLAVRGEELDVDFVCSGRPKAGQLAVTANCALGSWVEAWYPVLVQDESRSFGAMSRSKGRTTFRLPAGWSAVSNGRHVSREETVDGVIDVWETDRALSRSFAAGAYHVSRHRSGELEAGVYMLSNRNPKEHVTALANAVAAMEARLGPYPFPSFAVAEVPSQAGSFGASSEQGFIMVKPRFLAVRGGNLPLFAHEAAHGWWGNLVNTGGPGAILCSESLAQYGAVIAIEAMEGESAATKFLQLSRPGYLLNQCARGYFALARRDQDRALATLGSGGIHHTLSDSKGHWVYHMLRHRVGDEVFFATLRQLIARFAGKSMRLDDVRAAFIDAAPNADLEVFFSQWLDRPGAPVLELAWKPGSNAATVFQRQPDPYDLRIELRVTRGDRSELLEVELTQAEQRIEVGDGIDAVELDPHHRVLRWLPKYGPPPPGCDVEVPAADFAEAYAGSYRNDDRDLDVEVTVVAGRVHVKVAGNPTVELWPVLEHQFRSDDRLLTFEMAAGKATAIDVRSDDGSSMRVERVR